MGSKRTTLWRSEPANPKGFARRIPSTECVMTHSHLLTIFPVGKMAANVLARGYSPLTPVNAEPQHNLFYRYMLFCPKSIYAGNGDLERKCPFMGKERERKIPIQVYLSEDEKYVLDNKVKASEMRNISEYIRHMILYNYTYDCNYDELREYNRQLSAIGRNINMIRERIMKTGNVYEDDVKEIKELMEKVWLTHESTLSKAPLKKL